MYLKSLSLAPIRADNGNKVSAQTSSASPHTKSKSYKIDRARGLLEVEQEEFVPIRLSMRWACPRNRFKTLKSSDYDNALHVNV